MPRRTAPPAALLAASLLASSAAFAQTAPGASDLMNLEPQLPAEVEDAEPTRTGVREVQLPVRMTREEDDDWRFLVEPRFQFGFAPRWQASVGLPLILGSSDRTNSGNLRGEVLYKWLDEGSLLPAVAFSAGIELPTGKDAEGNDLTLKALATRTLGDRPGTHQLHGNVAWRINDEKQPGERSNTVRFIVGYSTPLTPSTVIVADLVRGHGRLGATGMATIYEVGVRYQFTPGTIASLGIASGDGGDAPDWQVTAGFQTRF